MKIAILSDIHDQLENFDKALKYIKEQGISRILFLGDFCSPFPVGKVLVNYDFEIDSVWGNTEDKFTTTKLSLTKFNNFRIHGEFADLEIENVKIFMNHYPEIGEEVASNGKYDLVCHGHTHQKKEEKVGKTILLNPGEIAGFKEDAGFVIFETSDKTIEFIKLKDI